MMKGEEFFVEVEERLIERDLSGFLVLNCVLLLSGSIFLCLYVTTIRIETLWAWSYWLEVIGFALIVGDLFFEKQTKNLMSLGEGHFPPGDANFLGWWKIMAQIFFFALLGALFAAVPALRSFISQITSAFTLVEFGIVIGFYCPIFFRAYLYVVDKTNDRVLGNGVGVALVGLTFATSAQVTTAFF